MTTTAQTYVDALQMLPHPEGGFYKESYRSPQLMTVARPADGAPVQRNASTGIYFLLEQGKIQAALSDYTPYVSTRWVTDATKLAY